MFLIGCAQHFTSRIAYRVNVAVMNCRGSEQPGAAVAMLVVVPGEEIVAESVRLRERIKPLRELRANAFPLWRNARTHQDVYCLGTR